VRSHIATNVRFLRQLRVPWTSAPRLGFDCRDLLSEADQLLTAEDAAGLDEHLAFFFLDMVFKALLQHLELRAPLLVAGRQLKQLPRQDVGDVVLLISLEDDVPRFRVLLQGWIQNLLFDELVQVQFRRERVE